MEDNNFLTMDNILTSDEAASLFEDNPTTETKTTTVETEKNDPAETEENKKTTTEIEEGDNPFEEASEKSKSEKSESVGSEEEGKGKEDTDSDKDGKTPSKTNFYSSIADALKEEGVFPDLDDTEVSEADNPEKFRELIQKQIEAGLDDIQKRVYEALSNGAEPTLVKQYENTIGYLNSISDEQLNDESELGENLRRRLLQQDFLNRGYSQERATKMTEKLFASGEDIEEAKQALIGNKEYFSSKYQELLDQAKEEKKKEEKMLEKKAEQLKKDILSQEEVFGNIKIDKATRQKVYDNISKPIYKNKETGEYYTALQKYRKENETEYLKNVGLLFTLTDGFTNLEKLVSSSAKKEVKQKLKELEHTLNNTIRDDSGVLNYVGNSVSEGNGLFLDRGFVLDVK